jgi:hypothetical protein
VANPVPTGCVNSTNLIDLSSLKPFFALLCLLTLGCNVPAVSQETDTLRIESGNFYFYPRMFAIRLVYQEKRLPLTLSPLVAERQAMYQPNGNRSFGIGTALVGVSFAITFALPQALQRNPDRFGSTVQRDLRFNAFSNRLGLQIDRQDYRGYYLNNISQLDSAWSNGEGYPLRSDLHTQRLGVGFSYLLRPDRFSYSVAFNNIRRQRVGGGTFFFQVYGGRLWVRSDSLLLPGLYFRDTGSAGLVEEVKVHHGSLMAGYAHTFVMGKFYLMASMAMGPELQKRSLLGEQQGSLQQWAAEGRLQLQTAFGYDDDKYFWNIAYNSQRQQYEVGELGVSVNTNGVRLLMGRRFKELGFMHRIRQTGIYKRLRPYEQ